MEIFNKIWYNIIVGIGIRDPKVTCLSDFPTFHSRRTSERQGVIFMQEIWKDITEYEGYYQVSNLGNVKSLTRYIKRKSNYTGDMILKGKMLSQNKLDSGYRMVHLSKNGVTKPYLVHRLVAQAFIPNPKGLPIINHKDENKSNNCLSNLEWCDTLYNINYGTVNERISANKSTPVIQYSLDGSVVRTYRNARVAGKENNISINLIYRCCYKKCCSYKGYVWRFDGDIFSYKPTKNNISIAKLDLNKNIVQKYDSIRQAVACEHISFGSIKKSISLKKPHNDFYWELM